jgi:hypothetical protein
LEAQPVMMEMIPTPVVTICLIFMMVQFTRIPLRRLERQIKIHSEKRRKGRNQGWAPVS